MKLDETTEVLEVKMRNIETGEEKLLSEKPPSKQSFMSVFEFGKYKIQLRLDWDDIRGEEPTLDADIWIEDVTGKKNFIKKGSWHHTGRKKDEETGLYVYKFEFQDLETNLTAQKDYGEKFYCRCYTHRFGEGIKNR